MRQSLSARKAWRRLAIEIAGSMDRSDELREPQVLTRVSKVFIDLICEHDESGYAKILGM